MIERLIWKFQRSKYGVKPDSWLNVVSKPQAQRIPEILVTNWEMFVYVGHGLREIIPCTPWQCGMWTLSYRSHHFCTLSCSFIFVALVNDFIKYSFEICLFNACPVANQLGRLDEITCTQFINILAVCAPLPTYKRCPTSVSCSSSTHKTKPHSKQFNCKLTTARYCLCISSQRITQFEQNCPYTIYLPW